MRKIAKLQGARFAAFFVGATLMATGQAAADQVIPDDLIVQGSTCSGFDCVNGESFGFDTLRLKENNTQIGFDDTSVGAFPANDWAITANDSASGGANFLAINDVTAGRQPFRVTAGAPTASVFVASTGNVGFGTATPILDLHANTADTPAIRLEQNNGSGFTAQTWDMGGNEANFFVRDVTSGSRLPFRIRPGAPTSSIDISASGNVGIGTASPASQLHVKGSSGNTYLTLENPTGGNAFIKSLGGDAGMIFQTGATSAVAIRSPGNVGIGTTSPAAQFHTTGSVRFAGVANCSAGIVSNAAGTLSCAVSSARFKHVRGALSAETAVANVMALRPRVGTYIETPDVQEHWLIAEDVAAVDPALAGFRDGEPYTVKTQNVIADLVAVIQQQQRRIEALERSVAAR